MVRSSKLVTAWRLAWGFAGAAAAPASALDLSDLNLAYRESFVGETGAAPTQPEVDLFSAGSVMPFQVGASLAPSISGRAFHAAMGSGGTPAEVSGLALLTPGTTPAEDVSIRVRAEALSATTPFSRFRRRMHSEVIPSDPAAPALMPGPLAHRGRGGAGFIRSPVF